MVKTQFSRLGDEGTSKFFRDGVSDCMDGELLSNKTESSGVMVGNVFVPASEIISSAQFQISVEQFEIIKDGVAKIRMTTSPIVHEKNFKKDCFGKKLYQFYQKVKKIGDDF